MIGLPVASRAPGLGLASTSIVAFQLAPSRLRKKATRRPVVAYSSFEADFQR
ncbi:MAG: hypothetical protein HYY24_19140 [Verrucomicrobia bacterium]|nr:hypothetical protein [Verrucomicrobiota bacterium]